MNMCKSRSIVTQGRQCVSVNTYRGFNPHSKKWNIYLNLYYHFFTVVALLNVQCLRNLVKNEEQSTLLRCFFITSSKFKFDSSIPSVTTFKHYSHDKINRLLYFLILVRDLSMHNIDFFTFVFSHAPLASALPMDNVTRRFSFALLY